MSVFLLKLLAAVSMMIDHLGSILGPSGWEILPSNYYILFRNIGRTAFPLYAFLLVNGFIHTRSKNEYMKRIMLGAITSQIPFTLALYPNNSMNIDFLRNPNYVQYNGIPILGIMLILLFYLLFCKSHKKPKYIIVIFTLFIIFADYQIKVHGLWVNSSEALNVFYTLAFGLMLLICIEGLKIDKDKNDFKEYIVSFTFIALGLFYFITRSDYGLSGIILIFAIYITRNNKVIQALSIAVWGLVFYGFINHNLQNGIFTCCSSFFIYSYNGNKGLDDKHKFYSLYPAHLFLLGLMNILHKIT